MTNLRKTGSEYRVGVGASSVLMVLVVLALAALSLLSLGSARSNAALSDRNRTMTLGYYQAAAQAQQTLAAMDELAQENASVVTDASGWNALFARNGLGNITVGEDGIFSFALDAGAQRSLVVEGNFTPALFPRLTLTRHELVSHSTETDNTLNLLEP